MTSPNSSAKFLPMSTNSFILAKKVIGNTLNECTSLWEDLENICLERSISFYIPYEILKVSIFNELNYELHIPEFRIHTDCDDIITINPVFSVTGILVCWSVIFYNKTASKEGKIFLYHKGLSSLIVNVIDSYTTKVTSLEEVIHYKDVTDIIYSYHSEFADYNKIGNNLSSFLKYSSDKDDKKQALYVITASDDGKGATLKFSDVKFGVYTASPSYTSHSEHHDYYFGWRLNLCGKVIYGVDTEDFKNIARNVEIAEQRWYEFIHQEGSKNERD